MEHLAGFAFGIVWVGSLVILFFLLLAVFCKVYNRITEKE
jgi:hypothetical protein